MTDESFEENAGLTPANSKFSILIDFYRPLVVDQEKRENEIYS